MASDPSQAACLFPERFRRVFFPRFLPARFPVFPVFFPVFPVLSAEHGAHSSHIPVHVHFCSQSTDETARQSSSHANDAQSWQPSQIPVQPHLVFQSSGLVAQLALHDRSSWCLQKSALDTFVEILGASS